IATIPAPRAAASSASSAVSASATRPNRASRASDTSQAWSVRAKPSRVVHPARTSLRNTVVASPPDATTYRGASAGSPAISSPSAKACANHAMNVPSRTRPHHYSSKILDGKRGGLGAGPGAQLAHAGTDVRLHRLPRDAQLPGDPAGRLAVGDQAQHVAFP